MMSAHFAHYIWHLVVKLKAAEYATNTNDAREKVLGNDAPAKHAWQIAQDLLDLCIPKQASVSHKVYIYIIPDGCG